MDLESISRDNRDTDANSRDMDNTMGRSRARDNLLLSATGEFHDFQFCEFMGTLSSLFLSIFL
jgi:hypothetical protein